MKEPPYPGDIPVLHPRDWHSNFCLSAPARSGRSPYTQSQHRTPCVQLPSIMLSRSIHAGVCIIFLLIPHIPLPGNTTLYSSVHLSRTPGSFVCSLAVRNAASLNVRVCVWQDVSFHSAARTPAEGTVASHPEGRPTVLHRD